MVLRPQVHKLPDVEFSERTLRSEEEWRRAYVVLTFLSQGYIWAEGETGIPSTIPKLLAVPWLKASEHVGIPPVVTYGATVLYNWGLRDPCRPMTADNLYIHDTFTGTEDESWFYVVPILVELAAVSGIHAIVQAFTNMIDHNLEALTHNLEDIRTSVQQMELALKRMYEHCDPKTFYLKIRPFQAGSKGLEAFPKGLVYEGVSHRPVTLSGASAAQSSAIPTFDIFLGAKHSGKEAGFLEEMRKHMPPPHRRFLEELDRQPSVREFARQSGDAEVIMAYNRAVDAFADFRGEHVILAARYIVMQKSLSVNASLDAKGTGGTDFMQFLKKVRDETLAIKINL